MDSDKHQTRSKKGWISAMLVFLLLIGGTVSYAYYQYKQGITQSLKNIKKEKTDAGNQENNALYNFEGKKDSYGDTNILLLGSDAREDERSRADTIMIAHYNENRGMFKITSVMRDCYVAIPGYGKHKINAAFAYGGPELMRQTIKQNFGIDLQYYAIVDFQGFVHLIDEAFPKGVEINVEKKMSEYIGVTLDPGLQRVDGEHLLGYVRFRHDAIGDFGRVERQQGALKAVGNQLKSIETIPKLPKLVGILTPFINTNMDTTEMFYLAKDFISKNRGNVPTFRIPIKDSFSEPNIPGEGAVLDLDIEKNKEALHQFISQ